MIYGVKVVREYLKTRSDDIKSLHLLPSFSIMEIKDLAERRNVVVRYESIAFFSALEKEGSHQGIAASLKEFSYCSLQSILEGGSDILLFLEEISDPRNLGALLRTAEAVGVGGVIFTRNRSAPLSATVEKTAVGATAHLSLCRVENMARALDEAKAAGYWIVGLTPNTLKSFYDQDLPRKIVVLLGGEEKGLRTLTRTKCDFLLSLPMKGKIESLNVSVAGAITLYELLRRKLNKENLNINAQS